MKWLVCLGLCVIANGTSAGDVTLAITNTSGAALTDAVVHLTSRSGSTLIVRKHAEVDQRNKTFIPDVTVIPVGTAVSFPNSDNIRHHVYSFSPAKVFDLKLYSGRPAAPIVFDKPGVVTLGCNIHDQMIAWIAVVDSNWYAKSNRQGIATIHNVPNGDYVLHLWHPGLDGDAVTQPLHVAANTRIDTRLNAKSIAQLRQELTLTGAR